ncbi:haloacid dehalogenase, type II [Kwoniella bestiolae CBS 10118]|uniref:Haloacid dehalogenase, type II n=1 Tax=Kwoniella bestiolae CBS 10118 TaxID=1296100 RepID=A0A1B9FRX5_9TREE|nr:haloacid dehalogenase, type II [Kwoniella bestiolae CBS 10118]OCF21520.1 haloacid dehalogenase, type II [Kwoniella bestiolae CBS 10118]
MENCKALIFDCYGTLIDWEQGSYNALQPIFQQKTCPVPEKVFETLGKIKARIQAEDKTMLYPAVLKEAYRVLTGELRLWYDEEAAEAYALSVGAWPAFPDSQDALSVLKGLDVKLVIHSNVDNASFEETRQRLEGSWGSFDNVFTAEDIGSYKPDYRNFHHILQALEEEYEIQPNEVAVVANSKRADIAPARRLGLKTVWINRPEAILGVKGYEDVRPDYEFGGMEEFAEELKRIKEDA